MLGVRSYRSWIWKPVGKEPCEQYANYLKMRLAEALVADCDLKNHYSSIFSFYGRWYELSAEPHIHGADKMIKSYGEGKYQPLTHLEYLAVTDKFGRLGAITEAARRANKLHPEFLKQEISFNSKGKIPYPPIENEVFVSVHEPLLILKRP